jgi:hypothetical protein
MQENLIIKIYPENDPDVIFVKAFRPHKINWTVSDLSEFLGKSKKTIRTMLFTGEINGFVAGGEWKIPYMNIVHYLKENSSLNKED